MLDLDNLASYSTQICRSLPRFFTMPATDSTDTQDTPPTMNSVKRDAQVLARNAFFTGCQFSSLLAPPIYTAFVFARRGRAFISVNCLLRATWMSTLGGGAAYAGLAHVWNLTHEEKQLRENSMQALYDKNLVIRNDHVTVGAALMAVLTPAIFWRRAHPINLVLGGSALGNGIGLLTYHSRSPNS